MLLAALKTTETRIAFLAVLLFSLATIVLLGPTETAQLENIQLQATARLIAGDFSAAQDLARAQHSPVLITVNRAAQSYRITDRNGVLFRARRLDTAGHVDLATMSTARDSVRVLPYGYADSTLRVTLGGQASRTTVSMTPTGRVVIESGL